MRKTELLAPAGSIEALHAAFIAGADAVYIGGDRFGARAYADNPDEEELVEGIRLAHRLGKKLYMTVNTLLRDREIEGELYQWMEPYVRTGLDGVIVQDFGVVDLFQRAFPDLPLHASTQMAVTGPEGARFLKEIGMRRIVPARELSLAEIRAIRDETGMEIEAFAHGAMCYSYSGMCLMSSLIGGRSGNRGRCAGVCRLPFDVYENGKKLTRRDSRYPLNMKDMCTVGILPEMIRAGVFSFKIEGRMKKPEYTAGVVRIYRKYLDLAEKEPAKYRVDPSDMQELWDLFNRDGFNEGCYKCRNGRNMIALKNVKLDGPRQKAAQDLTEKIRGELNSRELRQRLQAPVRGHIFLKKGEASSLTLSWQDIFVTVTGPAPEQAQKQPLSEETVRNRLEKTGGSPFYFSSLEVEMDGQIFLPLQALNELRREGLAELEAAVDRSFSGRVLPQEGLVFSDVSEAQERKCEAGASGIYIREDASAAPEPDTEKDHSFAFEMQTDARIFVAPETVGQLEKIAELQDLDGIYIESEIIRDPRVQKVMQNLLKSGKTVRLMLPYMLRPDAEESLEEEVRIYISAQETNGRVKSDPSIRKFPGEKTGRTLVGESGEILVRNLEELGLLRRMGLEHLARLDAGLYTMNSRAASFFAGLGYERNTMPLELNEKQMQERDNQNTEMIVYGRAPMMISAQCLKKTMDHCTKSNASLVLRDRRGAAFPVQCHCASCFNVIRNSLPTSLYEEEKSIRRLGCASFRLEFTDESPEEAARITEAFLASWKYGQKADPSALPALSTRGHFHRGVE